MMLKLSLYVERVIRFQMKLFSRFISFPIMISSIWLMLVTQSLVKMWRKMNSLKDDMMKSAIALSWGVLCSLFVFLVLAFLLVLGFAISGIAVRGFTESPLHFTQNLYFDYTKTTPTAVVPITASPSPRRTFATPPISRNHRIRLTLTLTLPDSDYNRKLGVFQVRVESLSASGNVIVSSSYPTMLRFKSQIIRAIESSMKIFPLITRTKSEGQNLVIPVEEFDQGEEETMGFKVSLQKRAEVENGSGVPEIYGATLEIASKLPLLKGMVWNWRLTIFVWIAFTSFMAEMMVTLFCCTPLLFPGRRSKVHRHFET